MMETVVGSPDAAKLIADEGSILALGVDSVSVRACLLEMVSGTCRLAGWRQAARHSSSALDIQMGDLLEQLGSRLQRRLWNGKDAVPLTLSDESTSYPPLAQVAAVTSPRTHVRVWLAGLTATQSLAAAEETLRSCPAEVVGQTLHSADLQIGPLASVVDRADVDLLLLIGGYDYAGADALQPLYELARVFSAVLARTPPAQRPYVIFGGNRFAAEGVAGIFQAAGAGSIETIANVRPAPGILLPAPLVQAVNYVYWRLCRRTEGMRELSRWVTAPGHIGTIESSFAQLVQVWLEVNDLPELHGLLCSHAWWLHVTARQGQGGLHLRYVVPGTRPADMGEWPPLRLVSGEWPAHLWPQPPGAWWDRGAMAPLVAAVGQVAPSAMLQVLRADILEPRT